MKKVVHILVIFFLVAGPVPGNDWPQFRGPNANGIADGTTPPLTWSETSNIKWKISTPGRGHSSPVIKGDNIYLTTAIEKNLQKKHYKNNTCFWADSITIKALCVNLKDGSIKWETELFTIKNPEPVHTLNSFATPTPVVDDTRLYCDFGTYGTACVETKNGKLAWKKRLPLDHEVGPGSSVALYKDLLILLRDGCDTQYITGLDKKSGKEAWKTMRPPVTGKSKDMHKSFSSPIIFKAGGKDQLVAPSAQWIASYDPGSGKEYWRVKHGRGFSLAAQPSVGNGMVYFCTGFSGNQLMAVRHDGKGDVTATHKAWETKQWTPVIPSPFVVKDRIYWVSGSGIACCANAINGEIIWHKKIEGAKEFMAAPILAGNRIYLVSKAGQTTVLEAGDEFKSLAVNQLSVGTIMATPAFIGKSIILRTDKHLYRIEE